MIVNELVKTIVNERNIDIRDLSASTDISLERIREVLDCKSALSPAEADKILKYFEMKLKDVLTVWWLKSDLIRGVVIMNENEDTNKPTDSNNKQANTQTTNTNNKIVYRI